MELVGPASVATLPPAGCPIPGSTRWGSTPLRRTASSMWVLWKPGPEGRPEVAEWDQQPPPLGATLGSLASSEGAPGKEAELGQVHTASASDLMHTGPR